jgi:hypothetical protein
MIDARILIGLATVAGTLAASPCRADLSAAPSLSFQDPPTPTPAPTPASAPASSAAGESASLPDHFAPEWTVQVDPTLWFVGPSGKFKLPVTSGTGPGSFTTEGDEIKVNDVDLASTRLRPAGTLTVASGKWRFSFWGSEYEQSREDVTVGFSGRVGAVPFSAGEHLKFDLSFGTYEVTAGYRIWDYDFKQRSSHPETATDAFLTLHLLGGVRLYDVEITAENLTSPGRAEGSHFFAEPMIGLRAEAVIDTDFSVILQLSAGGMPLYSTTSYSLDVVTAFQWRPTKNFGVQIGWRQLAFDLTDGRDLDQFEYTGRLAGLFTGVTIRF